MNGKKKGSFGLKEDFFFFLRWYTLKHRLMEIKDNLDKGEKIIEGVR